MNNKILDAISKLIALFTSLLIFMGIVSSVVYYKAFSINILDQITIGEALLLFLSKFSPFAISSIFGIFISRLYYGSQTNKSQEKENNLPQVKEATLTLGQSIYAIFVIIPLFTLSFLGFQPFVFWVLPVSIVIRLYVLSYIIKRLRVICRYGNLSYKIAEYSHLAGITLILVVTIAMTQAYLMYAGKINQNVTLHYLNGEILKSDSTTLYLGKTQSFYYLYNKPEHKAIILREDQINKIEITNRQ